MDPCDDGAPRYSRGVCPWGRTSRTNRWSECGWTILRRRCPEKTQAPCVIASTTAELLEKIPHLAEEIFGPASIVARCRDRAELERVITGLSGHLTASVHGTPEDLAEFRDLIALLETKVGRIIFNGFGTGLELCHALHHGGPYPATTDPHFTSIGQAGIFRFARPICYQNFPQESLPEPLRDRNTGGIWRLIDGQLTRDDVKL